MGELKSPNFVLPLFSRWYKEKFAEEYPRNRKAVIPFIY